ncbi:NDR1/HIN1-like protein 3 [Prunus yedoensis var. nudiflora]|uniref:NDR1/HIN1-like protein 3 n=1 Tax=Prunus yedoensis var. nudiflora TaxID=2094558 RepID=A0A314YFZ6_PRUYE|nr:NDR1/HIN1-like protein 3 [Prunus yedoensis var. nudiflora]
MCGHKTFALLSLGCGILAPFYQGHENTTVLHNILVQGKQLVRFEEAQVCQCKSDTVAGVYSIDLQLALRVKTRYAMSFKGKSNKIGVLCKLLVPLTTFGTSVDGDGDECFNTTKCFNTKEFFPETY